MPRRRGCRRRLGCGACVEGGGGSGAGAGREVGCGAATEPERNLSQLQLLDAGGGAERSSRGRLLARGASMPGGRCLFRPSPAQRAQAFGRGGAAGAAGSPRSWSPSLHRGSRSLAQARRPPGGVPGGLPPTASAHAAATEGARTWPRPAPASPADGAWRPASATQLKRCSSASPRVPERSAVLQNRSCRWGRVAGEGGRGRKEQQRHSPGAVGHLLPEEGREPGHRRFARRARTQLAFGGSGAFRPQGISHNHQSTAEIELALVCLP